MRVDDGKEGRWSLEDGGGEDMNESYLKCVK